MNTKMTRQRQLLNVPAFCNGAPTKRISTRNSTDNASWGWGPNKARMVKYSNEDCFL